MKNVALALSSGGPRGFAYIGAIEVLQKRGYRITSVAGSSAGALVGGIFAAGGLTPFKEWLYGLDPVQVVSLMDFAPSRNSLVKGDKIIRAIKERVPDVRIEDLPIPFTAVASDLFTGEEVVFREGPLFTAIRASISIPSMFRPVKWHGHTLVDGGLVNTFPLDLVARGGDDILVGFNVNRIEHGSQIPIPKLIQVCITEINLIVIYLMIVVSQICLLFKERPGLRPVGPLKPNTFSLIILRLAFTVF